MLSYSEVQKTLRDNSTGKPLSNKEITDIIDKVLGQTSLMMLKHELTGFFDSLKSEGKLIAVTHIYDQMLARPALDLYYLRPKLEDLFKEGVNSNPSAYLDLLNQPKLFQDLPEWTANNLHLILEKCLELSREQDLLRVLKKCIDKLSTIKIVDLLKKVMILDKSELAQGILDSVLCNKYHCKSCLETFIQAKTSAIKNKEVIDTLVTLKEKIPLDDYLTNFVKCLIQNSNYEEIVSNVDYLESLKIRLPEEPVSQLLMCFIDYDDWTYFRKYFLIYFESKRVSEQAIKKIISALVEKQAFDVLKYVVSVTIKQKDTFMNLKLSENQYKFIILALVKSHFDIASKLNSLAPPQLEARTSSESGKHGEEEMTESKGTPTNFECVKSESEESEEFFEIIDEAMIDKIISDIAMSEKNATK